MIVPNVSLKTLMVNPAFLQEIKDSNPELWHAVHQLRQLCESSDDTNAIAKRLVGLLDDLRGFLALQFALEEAYGYLEIPGAPTGGEIASSGSGAYQSGSGDRTSTLSTHVMSMQARAQHCSLYLELSEIAERAEEVQYRGAIHEQLPDLIRAARRFDARLREHEMLESELIERSFDLPCHSGANQLT